MSNFVQLGKDDCTYLLNLIQEMDSNTAFTARQRGYTVPKLEKIQRDPTSARLAYQDVEYILDLIEDDDLPEAEQQREMTRLQVMEIQKLQNEKFEEHKDIDTQREQRRLKRMGPVAGLVAAFEEKRTQ